MQLTWSWRLLPFIIPMFVSFHAHAQSAEPAVTGKGLVGCALLGGEAVLVTEAALKVRRWTRGWWRSRIFSRGQSLVEERHVPALRWHVAGNSHHSGSTERDFLRHATRIHPGRSAHR